MLSAIDYKKSEGVSLNREEIVSWSRGEVFRAFRPLSKRTDSPLSYFGGQSRPAKTRRPDGLAHSQCFCRCETCLKKGSHTILRCGCATHERRLRRQMGFDEHHATATSAPGFSQPAVAPEQDLHGVVHRAISELPLREFQWVHFRYRPAGAWRSEYASAFLRSYYATYQREHLARSRAATRQIVRRFVLVAMENEADPRSVSRPWCGDIGDRAWRKTYLAHWKRIRVDIRRIDEEALFKIGKALIL